MAGCGGVVCFVACAGLWGVFRGWFARRVVPLPCVGGLSSVVVAGGGATGSGIRGGLGVFSSSAAGSCGC